MNKKYIVRLSQNERDQLNEIVKTLSGGSEKAKRARILLKADLNGPAWIDEKIAESFGCRTHTIERIRRKLVLDGFDATIHRKKRATSPIPKKLDGKQEAQIIALRLGTPPEGYSTWSLRLLAEQVVELGIVESVSYSTVRLALKKTE